MDSSLRSSDCYYRDRQPEVSPTIIPVASYQQSSNLNISNNKYYAEMEAVTAEDAPLLAKLQLLPKNEVELEILDSCYGFSTIKAAFEAGNTLVIVKATEHIILQLRINVDMSVGRGELTRDQADCVTFVEIASETILAAPEVMLISEEIVQVTESMPEAAAIINEQPKSSRKKTKRGKSEDITLKDIAAAFGNDDSDD